MLDSMFFTQSSLIAGECASVASEATGYDAPRMPLAKPTLIIFGRLPVPGQCKTRLIPALGAQGAAQLYSRMLLRTLREAQAANLGDVILMLTPSPQAARLDASLAPLMAELDRELEHGLVHEPNTIRITLEAQPEGTLGERMQQAMARHLPNGPVMLMGSDLPALDSQRLREAADELALHDAVLQPSKDGGYGLIGLNQPCPDAFSLARWSHANVCLETLTQLTHAGRATYCLPVSWDVDEPEDLEQLALDFPALMKEHSSPFLIS